MDIGFIGLGNMGSAIAGNLLKAGHHLTVYNRTRSKAEELERHGAKVADTPAAAATAGTVLTMLADDHAVEDVVFGRNGILEALPIAGVHDSLSTISPAMSRRLHKAHNDAGQQYVASPVFGRPDSAEAAKLVVVAAGDHQGIERVQPLLDVIGRKTHVIGSEPWQANVIKVNGNLMIANTIELLGEIFAVLRKSNIDPKQFLEIVNGLFQSPVLQNYGTIIAEQRFEPAGFKLKLGLKDVKLALGAAEDVTAPLPIASLLRDRYLSAIARGNGDKDWSAVSDESAQQAGL
jgi:3-hydroxyisobutyrate dehydrogenase-like beta-hydroxyacid dehydrogenase